MDSRSPHGAELLVDRPSEATGILNTHFEAPPLTNDMPASSTPLEMSRLEPSPRSSSPQQSKAIGSLQEHGNGSEDNRNPGTSTSAISATSAPPAEPSILPSGENTTSITTPTGAPLTSQSTNPAIGPSSDQPTPIPKEADSTGPTLVITLLLPTGARHPYRMDEKYLKKRNVNVPNNNPVHMSVYTLKELIWREWREGMDPHPLCIFKVLTVSYRRPINTYPVC